MMRCSSIPCASSPCSLSIGISPAQRQGFFVSHQQHSRGARGRGNVAVRGILDSYRRDKGMASPGVEAGPSATAAATPAPLMPAQTRSQLAEVLQVDALAELHCGDEDDTPCPVDCVLEVFTEEEMNAVLHGASPGAVIVLDLYKTACGACKYIQPGFIKLCKMAGLGDHMPVIFVKHNVYDDEEEELTLLARRFHVQNVPCFKVFKDGQEVESFATRDKARLAEIINKYAGDGTV